MSCPVCRACWERVFRFSDDPTVLPPRQCPLFRSLSLFLCSPPSRCLQLGSSFLSTAVAAAMHCPGRGRQRHVHGRGSQGRTSRWTKTDSSLVC